MTQTAKPKLSDMSGYGADDVVILERKTYEELLAALKLIRRIGGGLIDGEKSAAEALAKCFTEAGEAIAKAEGR